MKKVTVIMVLLTVGFCGLAADRAEAQTRVDLTISADIGAGTWQAFAQVDLVNGDANDGIADFIINVWGTNGVTVTSSINEAPKDLVPATDPEFPNQFGFWELHSDGLNGVGISGSQPTVYGTIPDSGKDTLVLRDIGINAGNKVGFTGLISWAHPVLLASGTFSGTVGDLNVDVGDGTISLLDSGWTGPGNQSAAGVINGDILTVPEPATMTALALGGLALLRRRRK